MPLSIIVYILNIYNGNTDVMFTEILPRGLKPPLQLCPRPFWLCQTLFHRRFWAHTAQSLPTMILSSTHLIQHIPNANKFHLYVHKQQILPKNEENPRGMVWFCKKVRREQLVLPMFSVGDHLVECHSMAPVQVPFPKIRNLANVAAFSSLGLVLKIP